MGVVEDLWKVKVLLVDLLFFCDLCISCVSVIVVG